MPSYNLLKPEDREAMRSDRQSELDAVLQGEWPRDVNDAMRWSPPKYLEEGRGHTAAEWAAKMCRADLEYLLGKGGS